MPALRSLPEVIWGQFVKTPQTMSMNGPFGWEFYQKKDFINVTFLRKLWHYLELNRKTILQNICYFWIFWLKIKRKIKIPSICRSLNIITAWKCLYWEFFWFLFSRNLTEYGKIRIKKISITDTFRAVYVPTSLETPKWKTSQM